MLAVVDADLDRLDPRLRGVIAHRYRDVVGRFVCHDRLVLALLGCVRAQAPSEEMALSLGFFLLGVGALRGGLAVRSAPCVAALEGFGGSALPFECEQMAMAAKHTA